MKIRTSLAILSSLAVAVALPNTAQAQPVEAAASAEPARLRAAAEAVDPLGEAAVAEAAWQAYLAALEASGGAIVDQAHALTRIGDSRY